MGRQPHEHTSGLFRPGLVGVDDLDGAVLPELAPGAHAARARADAGDGTLRSAAVGIQGLAAKAWRRLPLVAAVRLVAPPVRGSALLAAVPLLQSQTACVRQQQASTMADLSLQPQDNSAVQAFLPAAVHHKRDTAWLAPPTDARVLRVTPFCSRRTARSHMHYTLRIHGTASSGPLRQR